MLSIRQNLLETIRGGKPDRYVNQYEFMTMMPGNPFSANNKNPKLGEYNVVNAWGITRSWPEGTPGAFPVHDAEHIVCKDITHWRDYVHAPSLDFPEDVWAPYAEAAAKIDRSQTFATAMVAPASSSSCTTCRASRRPWSTSMRSPSAPRS